jgi:hypothetical protein
MASSTSFGNGSDSTLFTFGIAASLDDILTEQLEIFFDVYFQSGSIGSNVDSTGFAAEIGAKYVFASDSKPWFEFKLDFLSGDDDQGGGDDENDAFLSYESVADLMIIEDPIFGLNWNTNLFIIKVSGGTSFSVGSGVNNLSLSAILGFGKTSEDVQLGSGPEDAIGTEFDARISYMPHKQVSFDAGVAFLTGSDILEGLLGGSGVPEADDSCILFTVGVKGRY